MGTYITIKAPEKNINEINNAFEILSDVDKTFSTFKENSEASILNKKNKISASDNFIELLNQSKKANIISNGAFDITIGKMTKDLYKFGYQDQKMPKEKDISDSIHLIGIDKISIINNEVSIPKGVKLDFGGIAKGYGVQKAAHLFKKMDVRDGVIAASGDIFCTNKCEIGITNPFDPDTLIATFQTSKKYSSISTSGNYQRYIKTKKNNHLLDPKTAKPQQNIAGVTLISTDANTLLDALATAVTVMQKNDAIEMLNRQKNIAYFIIYNDKKTIISDNFSLYTTDLRLNKISAK